MQERDTEGREGGGTRTENERVRTNVGVQRRSDKIIQRN